jgi:hypothetical protein
MKCFECPYLAYAGFDENTYYVRWCDQRNRKCSEIYPEGCPVETKEKMLRKLEPKRFERYMAGLDEYYARQKKVGRQPDMIEAHEYAEKFAGHA